MSRRPPLGSDWIDVILGMMRVAEGQDAWFLYRVPAPTIRTNSDRWRPHALATRFRGQLTAELPLPYTAGRWPSPPEVNYPAPVDELANQPRRIRQSVLEAEPFLQSIPAYRYAHLGDSPMPIVRSVRADVLTCHQFGFLKRNRNWSV
jgi:hypothetical protein